MKAYALFANETELSTVTTSIKDIDPDAGIEVLSGMRDDTPRATEAAPVAMSATTAGVIPISPAASSNRPLPMDRFASDLANDTQAFLARQLKNGASVLVIESDHGTEVERIVTDRGGRVWLTG